LRLKHAIGRAILLAAALSLLACKDGGGKEGQPGGSSAKDEIAALQVRNYVSLAYPMWARDHIERQCPDRLQDLVPFTNERDAVDPWGNELAMVCGPSAPAEARGFGVISMGVDGKLGTADDIKSWEQ
jgi:hypothetical protein